jgi:hypothetical protein
VVFTLKKLFIIEGELENDEDVINALELAEKEYPYDDIDIVIPPQSVVKEARNSLYYFGVLLDYMVQSDMVYFGKERKGTISNQLLRHSAQQFKVVELN